MYLNSFKPKFNFSKHTTATTFFNFSLYWDNRIGFSLSIYGYGIGFYITLYKVSLKWNTPTHGSYTA